MLALEEASTSHTLEMDCSDLTTIPSSRSQNPPSRRCGYLPFYTCKEVFDIPESLSPLCRPLIGLPARSLLLSQTCLPSLAAVVPDFALSPSQETPRTTISTLLNVTASSSPLPLLPSPPPLQRSYHSTVPPPRPLTVVQRTPWDPPPSCIMLGLGPLRSRDDGIQCICFRVQAD